MQLNRLMPPTLRGKLGMVALAAAIFACLGFVTTTAVGRPPATGTLTAVLIGFGVGLFEEFYVHTRRGSWLRDMHPLRSILVYVGVIWLLYLISLHLAHLLLWRLDDLSAVYRRLFYGVAIFTTFSIIGVLIVRMIHFIGPGTFFHLLTGTYHRPVLEQRVLLFLDVNGSTALTERLGPFRMRALIGKLLFDVAEPIADHGGQIYLHKGDGLIATWPLPGAIRDAAVLQAVDGMFATIERERPAYLERFGTAPSIRIGLHGGEVVVSEQGDAKRSIGIYGDTINIAARMEEAARDHGVTCVVSAPLAALLGKQRELLLIGEERVRGISVPIRVYEYRPHARRVKAPTLQAQPQPGVGPRSPRMT